MRSWTCVLSFLPALAACDGCRRAPSAIADAGPVDASADATTSAHTVRPWTGQVVARSVGVDMHPTRMQDDGLVVASGHAVYIAGKNGALQAVGTPANAVPLLKAGDDEIGGYDAQEIGYLTVAVAGPTATPFLRISETSTFQWTGKEWMTAGAFPSDSDEEAKKGLPSGYRWDLGVRNGTSRVWIGSKELTSANSNVIDEVAIMTPGQPVRVVPLPNETEAGPPQYRSCKSIPSADDRTYVACTTQEGPDDYRHPFYVLDGDHWSVFKAPKAAIDASSSARAIDAEGALWYVPDNHRGGMAQLLRVDRDGKEERLETPIAPASLEAPGYQSQTIMTDTGRGEIRHWTATILVDPVPPKQIRWIHGIFPMRSGEVFAIGRDSGSIQEGMTLVRFARNATPITPVLVPTATDARNRIHHARGVRTGLNRCVSLFVPFPRAQDAGSFYTANKAAIDETVSKITRKGAKVEDPFDIAIVEGRFEDKRVGGILFLRSDPAGDEDRMMTAARRLVEIATPNPASVRFPPAAHPSSIASSRVSVRRSPSFIENAALAARSSR